MDVSERLLGALSPILDRSGLELVDVVVSGGHVQVTVDRPGGVDLDALETANRTLSRALDEIDPFPGSYTLEISSPGLERRLRTPAHFAHALGETVTIRTLAGSGPARRLRGVLNSADEDSIVIESPDIPGGAQRIAYQEIERARTVFEWGPERAAKPGRAHKRQEKERSAQ